MAEIVWTDESRTWLKDIHDYIARDNPAAAGRVVDGILSKVELLGSFPELGYLYPRRAGRHLRILLYGHYRIAYLVDDQVIVLLGIYHGRLNIERFLNRDNED